MGLIPVWATHFGVEFNDPCGALPTQNFLWFCGNGHEVTEKYGALLTGQLALQLPAIFSPVHGECHADTTTEFLKRIFYGLHCPNLFSLSGLLRDTPSAGSVVGPCTWLEGQSRSAYVYLRWVLRGEKTASSAVLGKQQLSGWKQAGCTQKSKRISSELTCTCCLSHSLWWSPYFQLHQQGLIKHWALHPLGCICIIHGNRTAEFSMP